MALPSYEELVGAQPGTPLPSYDSLVGVPTIPGAVVQPDDEGVQDQYMPDDLQEYLATEEAQQRIKRINESAPVQLIEETVREGIPHDFKSYLESLYPPAAMAHHTADMLKRLSHGDISDVPIAGRVPELLAADKTPAGSIERYRAARNVLFDLGLLAGGGEGAPVRPGKVPPPLPSWVTRPQEQTLAIRPDPYAPKTTPDNLVEALARAKQSQLQKKQAAEQARQAALPGTAPVPPGVEGPAPPVKSFADNIREILDNRTRITNRIEELRPHVMKARELMPNGEPGLEAEWADLNAQLHNKATNPVVHAPPPETRFVTQESPPQGPVNVPGGAGNAPQPAASVPVAGAQPASPYAPPAPKGPTPIVQTMPQAASATPEVTAHHEGLTRQFGPGTIKRGEVSAPGEQVEAARKRAPKVDPYKAASKVTSGQAITPEELADLIVEHERLRNIATQHEEAMNANRNPQTITNWEAARQASEDFAVNVVKPAGTAWGEYGTTLQAAAPPNPMTLTGARDIAIDRLKRELTQKESKAVERNVAKNNKQMAKADTRTGKALEKVDPGKIPSRAEVQARVDKIMKDLLPCELP